ncbi:MAG: hypothetical protein LUH51_04740 [Firmicutes bacterium]|nr:hypothetical protein [Bacillota bacterium]
MAAEIGILLCSLALYARYGMGALAYLLGVGILTYGVGLLLPRRRWLMWPLIALNAAALLGARFLPLAGWGIAAPLGLSYFTLQSISYTVDVAQGKYEPERSVLAFGLYLSYFPHLFFGPIESYPGMKAALAARKISWDSISEGGARLMWGLFKKLAIAARAGVVVGSISAAPEQYRGAYALLAMLLYAVEIYADFSGGVDIVLGVSRMLGLRLSENFDAPYFSQSVAEFWRRWHITLGAWLRTYIYIPLGGNRRGKVRKVLNGIVTFLVSGLWHGSQYLLWGLLNGIFVACGERFKTRFRALNCALTFLLMSLLWSFFIWPDSRTALASIASLVTTFNYGELAANIENLGLNAGEWLAFLCCALLLWGHDLFRAPLARRFASAAPAARTAVIVALALAVLVLGMYGIGFEAQDFIYSRF